MSPLYRKTRSLHVSLSQRGCKHLSTSDRFPKSALIFTKPTDVKKKVLITKRFQPRDWSSLLLFLLSPDPLSVALRIDLVSSVCRFVRACQRKWRFLSVLRGINRFLISRVLCVFSAVLSVCLLLYVRHTLVQVTLTPASALPLVTYPRTSRGNADTGSCQERMNVLEAWSK